MRRTILSENQYDTKFMTAANMNAITSPFAPPKYSPIASKTALSRPSRSAVLIPLAMCLFYRAFRSGSPRLAAA